MRKKRHMMLKLVKNNHKALHAESGPAHCSVKCISTFLQCHHNSVGCGNSWSTKKMLSSVSRDVKLLVTKHGIYLKHAFTQNEVIAVRMLQSIIFSLK